MKPPVHERHPHPSKWHIITGAPCSGKTSVIKALEKSGHRVVHEVARAHIDKMLAGGLPLEIIKSDILAFERLILRAKVDIEQHLPRNQSIFMDRAVPDSLAYYRLEGLSVKEPLYWSRRVRYQHIFLFERLEFVKDSVRTEDQALAMRIEELIIHGYESLGYQIIRVPVLGIVERMAFILDHLERTGSEN